MKTGRIVLWVSMLMLFCGTSFAKTNLLFENYDKEGVSITEFGWTKFYADPGADIVVWTNTDAAGLGISARGTSSGHLAQFSKSLSSAYTLDNDDVLRIMWITKAPNGNYSAVGVVDSTGKKTYIGYDHRIGKNVFEIRVADNNYSSPLPSGLINSDPVIELEMVISKTSTSCYWRYYGNPGWQLIGTYSGNVDDVVGVHLYKAGTNESQPWVDAISLQKSSSINANKKFILFGINALAPEYLGTYSGELNTTYPAVDGVIITFWPDNFPNKHWGGNHGLFAPVQWTINDFSQTTSNLGNIGYGHLTENFLYMHTSVNMHLAGWENIDWFDTNWQIISQNVALFASIASGAGFKGLMLDFEEYSDSVNPLWKYFSYGTFQNYRSANGMPYKSLEEYKTQARTRGKEMMQAVTAAYPNITIVMIPNAGWENLVDYELLPAFVDGMLEGSGPNVRLIDGLEDGYGLQYYSEFQNIKTQAQTNGPLYSQLPSLYSQKMRYGFGIWLDYNPNAYGGWHTDDGNLEANFRSPARMEQSIFDAMSLADTDCYVWMYVWHPDQWCRPVSWKQPGYSMLHSAQCILCPHSTWPQQYFDALARIREPH